VCVCVCVCVLCSRLCVVLGNQQPTGCLFVRLCVYVCVRLGASVYIQYMCVRLGAYALVCVGNQRASARMYVCVGNQQPGVSL